MKSIRSIIALIGLCIILGCASRGTYTTLAASEQAAVSSYSAYVDGVIAGRTPTNNVPAVSQAFNLFQLSMRTAVDAAQGNTNAPATPPVISAQSNLTAIISISKGAP